MGSPLGDLGGALSAVIPPPRPVEMHGKADGTGQRHFNPFQFKNFLPGSGGAGEAAGGAEAAVTDLAPLALLA